MFKIIFTFLILIFISTSAYAEQRQGKVIGILDGDTITILENKTIIKVRLAEIDAPEKSQPYGSKSKKALSDLVFNKIVTVEKVDTDRYGRLVGKVYSGNIYINEKLISQGAAWVYRKYSKDPQMLNYEAIARKNKVGLWALDESQRIEPWLWRKQRKQR